MDELVILPETGDCGFIEYFDYKAEKVVQEKKIFASFAKQNKLMLEFPEPECNEPNVVERFFESPFIVAQNHNFEGVFAIDISNYINDLEHDRFQSLLAYIKANPLPVYLLMLYTDKTEVADRVYTALLHHMDIIKTVLPKPTHQQLYNYTIENLENLFGEISADIKDFFNNYYAKNSVGYDTADYLIRYLKLSGFKGELKEIETVVQSLDKKSSGNYHPIGF
jgi:hypothetical protein